MKKLLHLLFALATSTTAASILLPMAWAERGFCGGIGGEWMLIIAAAFVGSHLFDRLVGGAVNG